MTSSLQGAWELVYAKPAPSSRWRGITVYSDCYFAFVEISRDRRRFNSDPPTPAEEAEAFRTLMASSGRYEIKGQTLILHEAMSHHPNHVGTDLIYTFKLEGDHLTLWGRSPGSDEEFELHWQRLD